MLMKWAEDAEFEEIPNTRTHGKIKGEQRGWTWGWKAKQDRSILMWREAFETPEFNEWRWFQSGKVRQEL